MSYAEYIDNTHEVYDIVERESVFYGTEQQCQAWVEAQDKQNEYTIRSRGSDEFVPSDWWSGGFAENH